jgi:hypothetical protein
LFIISLFPIYKIKFFVEVLVENSYHFLFSYLAARVVEKKCLPINDGSPMEVRLMNYKKWFYSIGPSNAMNIIMWDKTLEFFLSMFTQNNKTTCHQRKQTT